MKPSLTAIFIIICLLMSGCSSDRASAGWSVVRQASWNTHFHDVYFVNEQSGWAVGDMGVIIYTDDGGSTWTAQESKTDKFLRAAHFINGKTGWIVGDSGVIIHTADGGKTWSSQASNTISSLYSVHFVDEKNGAAAGSGAILHTRDGGVNWQVQASDPDSVLLSIQFTDANTGWSAGFNGSILHTTDAGETWDKQESDAEIHSQLAGVEGCELRALDFLGEAEGWAAGEGNIITHTVDGGNTWIAQYGRSEVQSYIFFADALD